MVNELLGHLLLLCIGTPIVYFCAALHKCKTVSLYLLAAGGYLVGELMVSVLLMWTSFLVGHFSPWLVLGQLLILFPAGSVFLTKTKPRSTPKISYDLCKEQLLCFFVLVLLLLPSLAISYLQPLLAWDARSIWFFHGKAFYFDNALSLDFLKNPAYLWSHPDYPVFIPLLAVYHATFLGAWNEVYCKSFLFAHWLSSLGVLWFLLRSLGVRRAIALAAVATVHLAFSENALIGYADSIWSIAFCIGLLATLCACNSAAKDLPDNMDTTNRTSNAGVLLFSLFALVGFAIASLTKAEGLLATLVTIASGTIVLGKYHRQLRTVVYLLIPGLFASGIAWQIYCMKYEVHGEYSWLPKDGVTITSSALSERSMEILQTGYSIFVTQWGLSAAIAGLLVFTVLCNKLFNKKPEFLSRRAHFFLIVVYTLLCVQIYLSYLFTPLKLSWHLETSFSRLVTVVMLYTVIVTALLLEKKPET